MVMVRTANEIIEEEKREAEASAAAESQEEKNKEFNIIQFLETRWERARRAKIDNIEPLIFKNIRQVQSKYEPKKLAAIREMGGSDVFVQITDTKSRNMITWIRDIEFQSGGKPWGIEPEPVPELPPKLMNEIKAKFVRSAMDSIMQQAAQSGQQPDMDKVIQQLQEEMPNLEDKMQVEVRDMAEEKAIQLSREMDTILRKGGWYTALNDCIPDLVSKKNAWIKGPIKRLKAVKKIRTDDSGKEFVDYVQEVTREWERVSPLDIYPEPDSNSVDDGYLVEHVGYRRKHLASLMGIPGYREDEIRAVLLEFVQGGLREWTGIEGERQDAEKKDTTAIWESDKIEGLNYYGPVPGAFLLEWGVNPDKINDPAIDYECTVYKIGKHVIGAIINEDPEGRKPFSTSSFEDEADNIWGNAYVEKLEDCQTICNACARAIVNNVGMGSGPQVELNIDRLHGGLKSDMRLVPWKRWLTTNRMMQTGQAINFWQPQMHAQEILTVYNAFSKIADERGIPSYAHGDPQVGGGGNSLADYEKILTPVGSVDISKIRVGDRVLNSYGSFSSVTGVYPQGESDIFRVKFTNGEKIDCDLNHRWSVRDHADRKFRTLTTREILSKGLFRQHKIGWRHPSGYSPKWMIPIIDFVGFEERSIKIDPYTMGALLGDGDSRCRLTGMDKEVFDRIPYPMGKIDKRDDKGAAWTRAILGIREDYRGYGLNCKSIDKFIPEDYLFNSREIRLELLRGLMDTDGCCSKDGEVFFSTSSYALANDFVKLVRSLGAVVSGICKQAGGNFTIKGRDCVRQKMYRVVFNLPGETIFYLERKQNRVKDLRKTHIYISGIEWVGKHSATCISVDSKDNLFICENFIPTHNTASGLSMLITQASKIVKGVIRNMDRFMIIPSIEKLFEDLIRDPRYASKIGDINLVAKGATSLIEKEQRAVRMLEFLNATNNEIDQQITGIKGRAYLLKEVAMAHEIDPDKCLAGMLGPQFNLPGQGATPPAKAGTPTNEAGDRTQGVSTQLFHGKGGHPALPEGR